MKLNFTLSVLCTLTLSQSVLAMPKALQAKNLMQQATETQVLSTQINTAPSTCTNFSGNWAGMCKNTDVYGTVTQDKLELSLQQNDCGTLISSDGSENPIGMLISAQNNTGSFSYFNEWTDNNTTLKANVTVIQIAGGTMVLAGSDTMNLVNDQIIFKSHYNLFSSDCTLSRK